MLLSNLKCLSSTAEGALHCHSISPRHLTHPAPGQNGRHVADDIFMCIFVNEKFCILIEISLELAPKGLIDDNPPLVQIMAWRRFHLEILGNLVCLRDNL